ncbi:MAG: YbhB/YbcL family Raf kinase inhibitor-like protein [Opitutales bacterium]
MDLFFELSTGEIFMEIPFTLTIDAWADGSAIPAKYAFGKPGTDGPFATSDNVSPALSWANVPEGTRSFALVCRDPDVPSSGEDVNQEGKTVPADLPRVDFFHWVLVDIPATVSSIEEGVGGAGVVGGGKPIGATPLGITGKNDYTGWFAGDPDMGGVYGGYDGPCPPWNDSIVHHYHFELYALDVESLGLSGEFGGAEMLSALKDHVLAKATYMGTYSMNPSVPA